jgi:RimJ/RimL family protein N-acetyltransferase
MADLIPPDPPLRGARVRLRPFRLDDAAAVARACGDPDIPAFTMMAEDLTVEDARHWIARGLEGWPKGIARFAITVPPEDRCIGQIGVQFDFAMRRAEAFYWVAPEARRRGVASEALTLVTRWAFTDHQVVRTQLVTHLANLASQRVAERCGFRREGVLRAWEPVKGAQPDVVMWSRLPTDR